MLNTVLDNNIFEFEDNHYLQIDGTAIGSKLGKNFACTYMGKWEEELLRKCNVKPLMYVRFVDDIFGIWQGSEEDLQQFQNVANSIHPRIKVEMKYSESQIDFLDVLLEMQQGKIETTIYEKPTDTHMYVHNKSCHPKTTKKAVPYGLGIRAKRICSTEEGYKHNRKKIIDNMKKGGYSKGNIYHILNDVDSMDRTPLLQYKEKEEKNMDRVPLVLTFNANLPHIQGIVHKRVNVLHRKTE